ncbi:MAG TPA: LuxR family transcriptional regulator [Burkholderiales bacterium]
MGAAWLKPILVATSLADVEGAIEATVQRLGFRYFIYRGRFPQLRGATEVRLDNCPELWRERVVGSWDTDLNPTRLRALQEVTPILWRDLVRCQATLIRKAKQFGLLTGVTHPVHGPGGQWSTISFVKDRCDAQAEREIHVAMAKCHLFTSYVHGSLIRIINRGNSANVGQQPSLDRQSQQREQSLNERECTILAWVAAGKTISEIARLLPISERTVNFHLSNARRKLGASNSRQALTRALSLGLIGSRDDQSATNFRWETSRVGYGPTPLDETRQALRRGARKSGNGSGAA